MLRDVAGAGTRMKLAAGMESDLREAAAAVERQQLLAAFPAYGPLVSAEAKLGQTMRAGTLKVEQGAEGQNLVAALDAAGLTTCVVANRAAPPGTGERPML